MREERQLLTKLNRKDENDKWTHPSLGSSYSFSLWLIQKTAGREFKTPHVPLGQCEHRILIENINISYLYNTEKSAVCTKERK